MGSSSQTTAGTTTQSIDPQLKANYLQNYSQAQDIAGKIGSQGPWMGGTFKDANGNVISQANNPYYAQPTWGYGATGDVLQSMFTGMAGTYNRDAPGQLSADAQRGVESALNSGYQKVLGAGYNPQALQQVSATAAPSQVQISQVDRGAVQDVGFDPATAYLGAYQNPYTQGVINQGLSDLDRSRQLSVLQNNSNAVAAKAYGGDRQAIVNAETNRDFLDKSASFVNQTRAQNYAQAMQAAQTDLARRQQAQQLNQGADVQTALANLGAANQGSQYNAANAQQANLANAQMAQQTALANMGMVSGAEQFNAQQAQQAQLANQTAQLNSTAQKLQGSQVAQQLAQGQTQLPLQLAQALQGYDVYGRGLNQASIDAMTQAYNANLYRQVPGFQLQSGALGLSLPNLGGTTSGSSTTTYNPSTMQTLGGLAQLGGMFM